LTDAGSIDRYRYRREGNAPRKNEIDEHPEMRSRAVTMRRSGNWRITRPGVLENQHGRGEKTDPCREFHPAASIWKELAPSLKSMSPQCLRSVTPKMLSGIEAA
jgi:hypothetical protein